MHTGRNTHTHAHAHTQTHQHEHQHAKKHTHTHTRTYTHAYAHAQIRSHLSGDVQLLEGVPSPKLTPLYPPPPRVDAEDNVLISSSSREASIQHFQQQPQQQQQQQQQQQRLKSSVEQGPTASVQERPLPFGKPRRTPSKDTSNPDGTVHSSNRLGRGGAATPPRSPTVSAAPLTSGGPTQSIPSNGASRISQTLVPLQGAAQGGGSTLRPQPTAETSFSSKSSLLPSTTHAPHSDTPTQGSTAHTLSAPFLSQASHSSSHQPQHHRQQQQHHHNQQQQQQQQQQEQGESTAGDNQHPRNEEVSLLEAMHSGLDLRLAHFFTSVLAYSVRTSKGMQLQASARIDVQHATKA